MYRNENKMKSKDFQDSLNRSVTTYACKDRNSI